MLKQLTLVLCATALLPACIITDGSTSTDTQTTETGSTGDNGTTADPTTPTAPTTGSETPSTGEIPTTGSESESESESESVGTTTTETTDTTTTEDPSESPVGNCGWHFRENYYACASDGATPGAEDPLMMAPILCPDGLVEEEKCDNRNGPVGDLGCCTPEGTLFYCDMAQAIRREECGV